MRIAILETAHFQYALTLAEIFSNEDILVFTTKDMQKDMLEYSHEASRFQFVLIENISKDEQLILDKTIENKTDLFLINPVFDSYGAVKRIAKNLKCTKILTTHNINTWFNGRFWSPNSYKDRLNMKAIINYSDFIAVEDFIFNHLKSTGHKYYKKHKFLYIPFTIFHKSKTRKYTKDDQRLKIVLTGAIDGDRRRYEEVLEVINHFKGRSGQITFSFAGRAKGDYGKAIQARLVSIREKEPQLVSFFDDQSTADMFRKEMETSDLVLSTSTQTFKGMGTVEYIGKTKPTAAIHDMMSYELPGLLPSHLQIPVNLKGSVFNYKSTEDLILIFEKLLNEPSLLTEWKDQAKINSLKFSASEIRKGLPF